MSNKRKTKFITNAYKNSKIDIGGPCEIVVQKINERGQVELLIITDYENSIDVYKIKAIKKDSEKITEDKI